MPNPRLASRYAKSLIDLSTEKGQLEKVYEDMKYIQALCKASKEFVQLLSSPVVSADKKQAIIKAVTSGTLGELTTAFAVLLTTKGREGDLPEIANAFIDQYNEIKGITKVKLTTAVELSEDLKKAITAKVNTEANVGTVELETNTDESLIGGFTLEFNNRLVDASISRDLRDIKKQFEKNIYVPSIR